MPKSTLRGRKKSFKKTPVPNNNIRNIINYLINQISGMGMSVISTQSRISKSWYLEVDAGKRRFTIRISDHALRHGKKHDFDIYASTSYEKAWYYMDFIKAFRILIGELPEKHEGQE